MRAPSRAVLAALRSDARSGAQSLAEQWTRRLKLQSRERARLQALYRAERALCACASERVAGVDEVGMGPLAGPVVAAAVILPYQPMLEGLDDSKKLRAEVRASLATQIHAIAIGVGIGMATREEIDRLNIYHAGLLAMRRAIEQLSVQPDLVAVDGRSLPELSIAQAKCIGGDGRVACIAAASIVAKQYRDHWMLQLDAAYPGYGFAQHVGYATPEHLRALERFGPTPEHRISFAPVRQALGGRADVQLETV